MLLNRHQAYYRPLLNELARHAAEHSPYYRDAPWAARARMGLPIELADIPVTPKEDYKSANERFISDYVPKQHGRVARKYTSGSSGEPSLVLSTTKAYEMHHIDVETFMIGWGFGTCKGIVKAFNPKRGARKVTITRSKGPNGDEWSIATLSSRPVTRLLLETRAEQLQCFPHIALAVLEEAPEIDFLKLVVTLGEIVPDELLQRISRIPGCRNFDTLRAEEVGVIAGKCAGCGNYHPATGHAIVEILDDEGKRAMPGTIGRLVVTPLFNYAMPFLRYDIGDRVLLAGEHGCDRSHVSIKSIIGRDRDLFKLPDGGRVHASFSAQEGFALGMKRVKLVQIAIDRVEVRYIPRDPQATLSQKDAQTLLDHISPQLKAIPVRVDEFPLTAGGKYMMHECLV